MTAIGGALSVAETGEKQQRVLWDAELERIGRGAVIVKLGNLPDDPGQTIPLHLPNGTRSPKRGYVEEWLGRMDAEEKATDAKRFRYILIASVIAAAAAVVAAWPVIHDWIK
jgi:hypothetical protein